MPYSATQSFFHFTKRERRGLLAFLVLMLLLLCCPFVYRHWIHPPRPLQIRLEPYTPQEEKTTWASSGNNHAERYRHTNDVKHTSVEREAVKSTLFYFDPNQITAEDWIRLGVKPRTAETIVKYRTKGGRFRQPEDLKKIWGLSPALADQLMPYVRMATEQVVRNIPPGQVMPKRYQPASPAMLNINRSDSAEWEALPGIGPALARRILRFRTMLGGFYSVDQVAETFGLPDSTFQRIRSRLQCNAADLVKISINNASPDQLKQHPYIRFGYARKWEAYRHQHGGIRSREELQQALLMPDSAFGKLMPYLQEP